MDHRLERLIRQSREIFLTSHRDPDLDAICSVLAMYYYLRKKFPKTKVEIILSPKECEFEDADMFELPNFTKIKWINDIADYLKEKSLVICLDGTDFKYLFQFPKKF